MTIWEIILLSIALAMDATAVSMVAAASGYTAQPRAVFRLAFHFGLFQAGMPALGWLLGSTVADQISAWDHWIAFALLTIVGVRMIYSGVAGGQGSLVTDPTRGLTLITLSLATSMDALAVGLSFSMLNMAILVPCLMIGFITLILSILAVRVGRLAGRFTGKRVELAGGLILIAIGLRILVSHLY